MTPRVYVCDRCGEEIDGNLRMFIDAVRQGEILRYTATGGMADDDGGQA